MIIRKSFVIVKDIITYIVKLDIEVELRGSLTLGCPFVINWLKRIID